MGRKQANRVRLVIDEVQFRREADDSPDLSYLGKYTSTEPAAGVKFIDRQERGDQRRGQHRYFVEGCGDPEYIEQDYKRMEDYGNGWGMLYVYAAAEVSVEGVTQTIRSGGLGGVESDSGADYFEELKKEELGQLRDQLVALGFSSRAISKAFKDCKDRG